MQVDKINELIDHVKKNSDELVAKGANKKELQAHVAGLEAEMKKPKPDHGRLETLLASLETTVEEAEETLAASGVFRLLNTIFGTGVPSP
ncbi:MAG TPA: hypothetical protein VKT73_00650 [Xanthobacteraceae bacterium]|nr:hypothetical protein [Xanthobacteraceae bacterium]